MKRVAAFALVALVAAGCAAEPSDEVVSTEAFVIPEPFVDDEPLAPEVDDAVTRLPWAGVGTGVAYKGFATGKNVVVIYGGYTAQLDWVERWCDELYRMKGVALDIGHLYAVQGPNNPGYRNHEVQNSKLAAHLGQSARAANAQSITVIAHSSGTYVADELFKFVKNGSGGVPADTVPKIAYYDLDGGGPADDALVRRFARLVFVWAHDAVIGRQSHNAEGMKSLGEEYASLGGAFKVVADRSGCDAHASGGLWCMHDALINTKPHNPVMYDLKNDYTDFAGTRHLVTSYLDQ